MRTMRTMHPLYTEVVTGHTCKSLSQQRLAVEMGMTSKGQPADADEMAMLRQKLSILFPGDGASAETRKTFEEKLRHAPLWAGLSLADAREAAKR